MELVPFSEATPLRDLFPWLQKALGHSLEVSPGEGGRLISLGGMKVQPLLAEIAKSLGIGAEKAGYLISLVQLGYAAGVLFIVPMEDSLDRRNMVSSMLVVCVLALAGVAVSPSFPTLALANVMLGLSSSAIMVIVPYVASHAHASVRGKRVSQVMTGLFLGIFVADVAVQGLQVTHQSVLYQLAPHARARITSVFITMGFVGMSLGSALASLGYAHWGWKGVCLAGGGVALLPPLSWVVHSGFLRSRAAGNSLSANTFFR